jgi:hypothetical protein
MMKTGSELTSEMVGPAGSTSEGAFSCTNPCAEDELWPFSEGVAELLLELWERAMAGERPAGRQRKASDKTAEDE